MATLDEEKRKRQQAANAAYGTAIGDAFPTSAIKYAQRTTPAQFGSDVRGAVTAADRAVEEGFRGAGRAAGAVQRAAVAPVVSVAQSELARGKRLASGVEDFARGYAGLPARQATTAQRPAAVTPTRTAPAITAAGSDERIRAIANEGRTPDRRAAPPVIERPAVPAGRAVFAERPEGGQSAFGANTAGTDRTGFAATPQEMQRYRDGIAQQNTQDPEAGYRSALQDTALSSGDTWFDFMQKNQRRSALISARKAGLEGEKLASAERLQERRGALEAGLQQERFGAERGLLADRLSAAEKEAGAQRDFDRPFKESAMRSQEADIGYKGALGAEAGARGELAKLKADEAKQEQALRKEYAAEGTSTARRNVIANILQGKQDTSFDTLMGKVLENAQDPNAVITLMSQAKSAANDPSSPYFGDPLSAYSDLSKMATPKKEFAYGGVVYAEGYAQGGAVGVQEFGGLPEVDETATLARMYTQYTQTTQAMGATPVDFSKFSALMTTVRDRMAVPAQEPSAMGMPGYAEGGAVDVSGRQVLGPGTGTSDSIPAIIDGQTPAALSTNEFVWTANATENASPAVLKAVMSGLERNDPEIVSGIMALAAKAVKKPAQPAVE